jgi:hypothetical protein
MHLKISRRISMQIQAAAYQNASSKETINAVLRSFDEIDTGGERANLGG